MAELLVTGAASGIGAAVAATLTAAGNRVIGIDRVAKRAAPRIVPLDLGDAVAVRTAAARLPSTLSGICHAAGLPGTRSPRDVLFVNVLGIRDLTRGLAPVLEPGAAVVVISSLAGHRVPADPDFADAVLDTPDWTAAEALAAGHPGFRADPYGMSKHIVHRWAQREAAENLGRFRVLSLSPGPVSTPLLGDFRNQMGQQTVDAAIAATGRAGEPAEIAAVAAFALSASASWLNGTDIRVDGGLTAVREARHPAAVTVPRPTETRQT